MKSAIFISEILCLKEDLRWEITLSVIASCFILQADNIFSDIAVFLCHSEECIVWMMLSEIKSSSSYEARLLPSLVLSKKGIFKSKRTRINSATKK